MAALMTKVARPPFIRNGQWFFPDICEDDFKHFMAPLTHWTWIVGNHAEGRIGWLDMNATWDWLDKGDCSLNELHMLTKMLDGIIGRGLRTKRFKQMLREEQEINRRIVAVCKRLRAKGQYTEDEKSNVAKFNKN
jgi:hypothetical protein